MSDSKKYMELCNTALEDFEKGKEAGQSLRTLYNRLYYACFYSAKAVLLAEGIDAKTHSGIADRVFTELYREDNLIDRETAAALSRIQTKRDMSDYELEINDDDKDLKEIEEKSREFIQKMKKIWKD